MDRLIFLALSTTIISCFVQASQNKGETVLSTVLTPETKEKTLNRQGRSYYDQRYGAPYPPPPYYGVRPLYDRLEYRPDYDRPSRCGRCNDDRYDDRDSDRDDDRSGRDRYDDDRRVSHRPTYGNRFDKNKYDDDDDRKYDRKGNSNNGTNDDNDNDKKNYDDKDNRPSGSRRGGNRDRNRDRDRDRDRRPDDRDRYRPDYYDRFLRDPYRDYERPYYEDPYRERRPLFERYPYPAYDDGYAGRYDGYGYPGYRRPLYEDRYDRGNGYDDAFGGYGPGVGRGPHESFRPWDETYRGQSGWDAGGRGYYFASGRPDAAPAAAWGRPEYARPQLSSGWQNVGYPSGYRDPMEYQTSFGGYQDTGYRRGAGTGYSTGWLSVGERRPYRDQSGVNGLDSRDKYGQSSRDNNRYGQTNTNRQPGYGQSSTYGQSGSYGQGGSYGQSSNYGQGGSYQGTYGQSSQSTGTSSYSTSTTPQTSYLHEREDNQVTTKTETNTNQPS